MQYDTHIKDGKLLPVHLTVNTITFKQNLKQTQNSKYSTKNKRKANIPAVPNSIRLHSLDFSSATSFASTNDSISARVLSF